MAFMIVGPALLERILFSRIANSSTPSQKRVAELSNLFYNYFYKLFLCQHLSCKLYISYVYIKLLQKDGNTSMKLR